MQKVICHFRIEGQPVSCIPIKSGHINHTWRIETNRRKRYILQRINHHVFRDVEGLMENIRSVTEYIRNHYPNAGAVLSLVPAVNGETFLPYEGEYYRVYENIEDSLCLTKAETAEDFRLSGVAFGRFQRQLADFPAHTLRETIPHFHDTPDRFRHFHDAIERDAAKRADSVRSEISFLLSREEDASMMTSLQASGYLPLRVTHNDTKLSNVLFDAHTRQPLCVIDLDTVMPGLAGNDFGDAIRFGASTAAEDERDLSLVHFSMPMFKVFAEGFLSECGSGLTDEELRTLPWGARLMTMECGMRFLTDYLCGDVYFHTERPGHNLDRCRTQLKLLAEMEDHWDEMRETIEALSQR